MRLWEVCEVLEQPWGKSPLELLTRSSVEDEEGRRPTPLVRAVEVGGVEAVAELVARFTVCRQDALAAVAVAAAAASPGQEAVPELASFVDALDERGWTALTHAAASNQRAVVVLLVTRCGADPHRASTEVSDAATAAKIARTIQESLNEAKVLGAEVRAKQKQAAKAAAAAFAAAAASTGGKSSNEPTVVFVDDSAEASDSGEDEEAGADADDAQDEIRKEVDFLSFDDIDISMSMGGLFDD